MLLKRYFALIILMLLLSLGCNRQNEVVVPGKVADQIIDSIAKMRILEVQLEADDQLDKRLSIEVKQKADSIVSTLQKVDTVGDIPPVVIVDSSLESNPSKNTDFPVIIPERTRPIFRAIPGASQTNESNGGKR